MNRIHPIRLRVLLDIWITRSKKTEREHPARAAGRTV